MRCDPKRGRRDRADRLYRRACDNESYRKYRRVCDTVCILSAPFHDAPRTMPDDPKPGPYAPDPRLPPAEIRKGRAYTEAELTAAVRSVLANRTGPDGKPLTQEEIAETFGVSQSVVSQALGYSREKNRQRGHALRRRILREWGGGGHSLQFAGPFWIGTDERGLGEKGRDVTGRFAEGENPYPHGDGSNDPSGGALSGPHLDDLDG